jgi:hypothetical protein
MFAFRRDAHPLNLAGASDLLPSVQDHADTNVATAMSSLRQSLRAAAVAAPESMPALVKDTVLLTKLLRNPVDNPSEHKYRTVKLTNPHVARILAHVGVRDLLEACGFESDSTVFHLAEPSAPLLKQVVNEVESVQHMVQELSWLHATSTKLPSPTLAWEADDAATILVGACITALSGVTGERF